MTEQLPKEEKTCKRHSWIVLRHFMSLTGKPMEALRCRFCPAHKNRGLRKQS